MDSELKAIGSCSFCGGEASIDRPVFQGAGDATICPDCIVRLEQHADAAEPSDGSEISRLREIYRQHFQDPGSRDSSWHRSASSRRSLRSGLSFAPSKVVSGPSTTSAPEESIYTTSSGELPHSSWLGSCGFTRLERGCGVRESG